MGENNTGSGELRLKICWALIAAIILTTVLPLFIPGLTIGMMAAPLLPALMLIHGSILYGWKGITTYVILGVAVGFVLEASSVANGFPFGSYVHNVAGPKPMGVPIQAITAYMLLGWFALVLAKAIVLDAPWRPHAVSRYTVPLVGGLILAGLDLPYDPLGATVAGDWTFTYPGGQFGVPLTNFLGWIFTGWVLFQIFAFIEHRFPPASAAKQRGYWLIPALFWLNMALKFPFDWMRAPSGTVSLGERTFVIADVHEAAVITSLFTLVAISLIATSRLYSREVWPSE